MNEWKEIEIGSIPSNWDYIEIRKTDLQIGDGNYSSKYPRQNELLENGVPFISSNDIVNSKITSSNLRYISEEHHQRLLKGHIEPGDVVIVVRGNGVGEVALITKEFDDSNINAQLSYLGRSNKIFGSYLYYLLFYYNISGITEKIVSGSAQPQITISNLKTLELIIPPLSEQRAIASILSSLDDKIDLLHHQNKTLEAMAETLFRQWFVEEADEGSIGRVSDLIEFNPTRSLSKGILAPYLEMANVNTDVFHPTNWYDREFSSGTKFINGDTLLARITPCLENGKSTYVTFLREGQVGWGSTEFIVMRSKEKLHPLFSYLLCKNSDFRDYAEGCLEGSSGRQRVNVDHLSKFEINIPTQPIIEQLNQILSAIKPKLHSNFMRIRTLENLRDTLLPKLMSGEVRVAI